MVFGHKHYVPILKGKRAEFNALGFIENKQSITPLIEPVPSASITETPRRMAEVWPDQNGYFIDLVFLDDPDDTTTPATPDHPVILCFADALERGQLAVPVTGLARSPTYQDAIRQVAAQQGNGLMIRLTPEDFEDSDELANALSSIPQFFNVGMGEIDLLLDLASVTGSSAGTITQMHRANIDIIPDIDQWRTLTVASAAFPLGLASLTRDEWNTVVRVDWRAWRSLIEGKKKPARLPAFSDYAIAQPALPAEGIATILAQIRYATPETWIVWKGRNAITDGFAQFFGICADLVQREEYRGEEFSWGDNEIAQKATNVGSCGNAQTWRQIGTNHHFETVLEQIASLP